MSTRALMVLGTSSHAGKSLLVAGLCHLARKNGWRVAPFKAQNMSLNSAVCPGGGEIGRAQALQAEAAGAVPCVEMNPILLKPTGEQTSQVVVLGEPRWTLSARDYYTRGNELRGVIREAYGRLASHCDLIVIEGAGSPAEPNLRGLDLANMEVADMAHAPCLLVADIERGGAFAHIMGTLALLTPGERGRIRGIVINKFRGDPTLVEPALRDIEKRTKIPVLGVLPHLPDLGLDEEDSVGIPTSNGAPRPGDIVLSVVRLDHISNFTDFDALRGEPGVHLRYASHPDELGGSDAILLPGSKGTPGELQALERSGMARALREMAGKVPLVGLCGGYQMLGKSISDPQGTDGAPREVPGLGLLDVTTLYEPRKTTTPVVAEPIETPRGFLKTPGPMDREFIRSRAKQD